MSKKKERLSDIDRIYYEQLVNAYSHSSAQFDKMIILIASGSLGISFTFITELVDLTTACYLWLLITSWIILAIVIFCSLISHLLSARAINDELESVLKPKNSVNKKNSLLKCLNIIMIVLILIALVFLIVFISLNL